MKDHSFRGSPKVSISPFFRNNKVMKIFINIIENEFQRFADNNLNQSKTTFGPSPTLTNRQHQMLSLAQWKHIFVVFM